MVAKETTVFKKLVVLQPHRKEVIFSLREKKVILCSLENTVWSHFTKFPLFYRRCNDVLANHEYCQECGGPQSFGCDDLTLGAETEEKHLISRETCHLTLAKYREGPVGTGPLLPSPDSLVSSST